MSELQELEAQFTALTVEWMNTIGPECHKDRDCHFYIERRWSYGDAPKWRAQHYGYWAEERLDKECATYHDALRALIEFLADELADAKKCIERNKEESN